MIKRFFIILVVLLMSSAYLFYWLHCHLDDRFFFSALDVKLRVIYDIRSDAIPLPIIAHILHNKITQGSVDIFNSYFHFWDIRFLLYLLSPLTFIGLLLRLFYFIKGKEKFIKLEKNVGILFLLIPLAILFHFVKNQFLGLMFFSLPLIFFASKGWMFLERNNKYWWVYMIFLIICSLYMIMSIGLLVSNFCHA